ncbi:MAG: hypothetical protein V2I48_17165 [Xanthomonadales bacterium]|jgi:hypothetical protein|nr:hypothetical protein [Xanthomonadales bacterium]
MRIATSFFAVCLVLVLSACSTHYTRPDTTEAQMQHDLERCKELSYRENPGDWTVDGPDYQARSSVGCPGGDCQAKPGQAVHGSPSVDMNRADRERAVIACMEARGYAY